MGLMRGMPAHSSRFPPCLLTSPASQVVTRARLHESLSDQLQEQRRSRDEKAARGHVWRENVEAQLRGLSDSMHEVKKLLERGNAAHAVGGGGGGAPLMARTSTASNASQPPATAAVPPPMMPVVAPPSSPGGALCSGPLPGGPLPPLQRPAAGVPPGKRLQRFGSCAATVMVQKPMGYWNLIV